MRVVEYANAPVDVLVRIVLESTFTEVWYPENFRGLSEYLTTPDVRFDNR